jgi:hypothetical protein
VRTGPTGCGRAHSTSGEARRRPEPGGRAGRQAARKLRLLYVACGDKDPLFRISQTVHAALDEGKVPHVYRVIPGGGHDMKVWRSDLYTFAQLIFREPGREKSPPAKRNDPPPARVAPGPAKSGEGKPASACGGEGG